MSIDSAREARIMAMAGLTAEERARINQVTDGPSVMRLIARQVAEHGGVNVSEIMGYNREPQIVRLRQYCWHLCRERGYSLPRIGAVYGRDHSTILDGIRTIRARMAAVEGPDPIDGEGPGCIGGAGE